MSHNPSSVEGAMERFLKYMMTSTFETEEESDSEEESDEGEEESDSEEESESESSESESEEDEEEEHVIPSQVQGDMLSDPQFDLRSQFRPLHVEYIVSSASLTLSLW